MNKTDIMVLFFLTGLLLGLSVGLLNMVFIKYTVKSDFMLTVLTNTCKHSKLQDVSIGNFGKTVTVECADGKILKFDTNSIVPNQTLPQSGNTSN